MSWNEIKILNKNNLQINLVAKKDSKKYLIEIKNSFNHDILNHFDLDKEKPIFENSLVSQYQIEKYTINIYKKYSSEIKKKLSKSKEIIFTETPEYYKNKTKLFIEKAISNGNLNWINDILEKKSEFNRIIFENDQFILMKDIVWTNNDTQNLYLLALPKKRNISCIRELTSNDIPLLKHFQDEIPKIVKKKYKFNSNKIYMFFHYLPSFYYLHLHICCLNNINLQNKFCRHHLLDNVIKNIEIKSDYYQLVNMTFEIPNNHSLFKIKN